MNYLQRSSELQLFEGGAQYFSALVSAIDTASAWVQLEVYILDLHGASVDVAQALMRAPQRGVRVEVLVDGIGSEPLPSEWQKKDA